MSYHKSKGLEFDVVFLPDMLGTIQNRSKKVFLESKPASSEILFQVKEDLSYTRTGPDNTDNLIRERRNQELVRLLYVAMTRAKERLYLPLHSGLPKNCILGSLMPALEKKFNLAAATTTADET